MVLLYRVDMFRGRLGPTIDNFLAAEEEMCAG